MGKIQKDMCPFSHWRAREANLGHMYGEKAKNMCPFSYWRARKVISECTGVVDFIKVRRQKKVISRSASLEKIYQ